MITSILVGVDDSDGARAALHWAAGLVKQLQDNGQTVSATMVAAWSRPAVDTRAILDDKAFKAAAIRTLDELSEELPPEVNFERITTQGYPTFVILDEAKKCNADLIVVGSRGRSAIAQVILGSISRGVAARSERPVVVIPKSIAEDSDRSQRTVVGYDDSPGARTAMRWALDNLDGPILAVSAWVLPTPVVYDPSDPELQQFRDASEQMLVNGLKDLCGGTIDARITPIVTHDDPRLAILDDDHHATQIVLGARAERGLKGLLLGSTVTYVASHATVPVFIVPPPEEDGQD